MSPDRPRQRLRFFENSPGQRHIEATDRHLFKPPDPEWRLGVIGTGTMGQEHIRVAQLIGKAAVTAIHDPHDASAAAAVALFGGETTPTRHARLDDLIADNAIDAFVICTPNHTHLQVLEQIMAAKKPVLLEKPMTTTLSDARRMMALVDEAESWVQLGLQYRYKAPYVEAWHEVMARQSIGHVCTLTLTESRPPFLDKVGQWNKFAAQSGGTLVEKCCHYFDLLNRFANSVPTRVYASGGQAVNFSGFLYEGKTADIDDHAFVVIDYLNGARAQFELNMFAPVFTESLTVTGDLGRVSTLERFDPQRPDNTLSEIHVETIEPTASRSSALSYGATIEQSGHFGATYHEHLAFLDQLAGHSNHAANLLDGLWSMLVAVAAQTSMARGEPVTIDELVEQYDLDRFLKHAE